MATIFKIRRRAANGAAGAPSTLLSGELSYNNADGCLYVGFGDDGAGNATSIKPFAKDDFSISHRLPAGGTTGQLLVKNSSTDRDVSWIAPPLTYTGGLGVVITGSSIAVDTGVVATLTNLAAKAPLASPALTGTPTAPTASSSTSNTQIATTAFVATAINALVNGAPSALDTLGEIATQIANDESGVAALTSVVGGKLVKASNLSDLADASAARGNLGLGSIAVQSAASVAVTGGTLSNVTISNSVIDGGTY